MTRAGIRSLTAPALLLALLAAAPLAGQSSAAAGDTPPPIVIIDGVVLRPSDEAEQRALFRTIQRAIYSIEILKGPAATERYGAEAAGGVIMITLKRDGADAPAARGAAVRAAPGLTGGPAPLMIVDGVVVSGLEVGMLGPEDIERIEVLKGAAAERLYGARASGGVIQITTRRRQHQ